MPSALRVFLILCVLSGLSQGVQAAEQSYLSSNDIPLTRLLPPPPALESAEQRADMDAVLAAQAARTPETADQAKADSTRSLARFAGALGLEPANHPLPLTTALFHEVAHETEDLTDVAKGYFKRPRPFTTNPAVAPLLVKPADGSRPTGQTPSYPSGHSAFAAVTGILLADMVPERRDAIFERAAEFAHNRLVAGVHYPSDIAAGRIAGTVIANALLHNPRFLDDYAGARAELRHALGLE